MSTLKSTTRFVVLLLLINQLELSSAEVNKRLTPNYIIATMPKAFPEKDLELELRKRLTERE